MHTASLHMFRAVAVMLLCLLLPHAVWAQSETEQRKLRLAQSYEQSGDMKNAARLYQELYEANKQQSEYFDGVVRSLVAQNQFAPVLPLLEEHIQFKHSDTRQTELHALKGDILWKMGRTAQADEAWKKALTFTPKLQSGYVAVAKAQAANRAFDLAIATLVQARVQLSAPNLFVEDLSQLYGAVGNFSAGVQEVLTLLKTQNNLTTAQGRISAYLITDKGVQQTREALEQAVSAEPNAVSLQRLYAWFLREIKDYNRALDVTARLDNMTNAQGRDILTFADKARVERHFDAALKAYGLVIDKGKRNPYALSAFYGYARTMESRLQDNRSFSEQELATIIDRYRTIIADYPQTQFAAESQYRIAKLTLEQLKKPQESVQEFMRVVDNYRAYQIAARASVDIGTVYLTLNRQEQAQAAFRSTMQVFARYTGECDEAAFRLAELEYFAGELDSAQEHLGRLAVNTNADIANDALELLAILDFKRTPPGKAAVHVFAQADLAERQQNFDVAIERYIALTASVSANSPVAPLAELALLRAGKVEFARKKYEAAQKLFGQLLSKYPESTYGDYAMMYTADSFAAQLRKDDAMQMYSQILVKYPRSTLLQEVRLKIRKLRGDA